MATSFFFTPEQTSTFALAELKPELIASRTVNRQVSPRAITPGGDSFSFALPAILSPANKRALYKGEEVKDSVFGLPRKNVAIDSEIYECVPITDEVRTFQIEDYSAQVLAPMARAVAEGVDAEVVASMLSVPVGLSAADKAKRGQIVVNDKAYDDLEAAEISKGDAIAYGVGTKVKATDLQPKTNSDLLKTFRTADRLFNDRGVPRSGRYMAVGSAIYQGLLAHSNLFKVNEAGTSDALRDATLGKLYGFTVVNVPGFDPYEAVAYVPEAFGLALGTPAIPEGIAFGSTTTAESLTLRYFHDYDNRLKTDRANVDVYVGADVLDAQRAIHWTAAEGVEEPASTATEA